MTITVTGKYSVKFRAFRITFGTKKGSINETIKVTTDKLKYRQPIDLPGPLDLVLEVEGTSAKVQAVYNGFPIYEETFKIGDFVKTPIEFKLKGFNVRGVKVENLVVKLTF